MFQVAARFGISPRMRLQSVCGCASGHVLCAGRYEGIAATAALWSEGDPQEADEIRAGFSGGHEDNSGGYVGAAGASGHSAPCGNGDEHELEMTMYLQESNTLESAGGESSFSSRTL